MRFTQYENISLCKPNAFFHIQKFLMPVNSCQLFMSLCHAYNHLFFFFT